MIIDESDYLAHYGILRKSGRYPWGSGNSEDNETFLGTVAKLRKEGMSEVDIAKTFDMTVTQLRNAKTIANNAEKQARIGQAERLKAKGLSNVAIGRRMGIPESTVRSLLAPGEKDKANVLINTSNMLKDQVGKHRYIDVGTGTEHYIGVSRTKLMAAIAVLKEQGYKTHYVKVTQVGTGLPTTQIVLAAPGVTYSEVYKNRADIKTIGANTDDGGRTYSVLRPPTSIDSKRVGIRYAEDGGADMDGVILVRRGVKDVALGGASYAQVRIAVNGSHYLKGMAMYSDDLPDGVDLLFNTNKSNTDNKIDAMKPMKKDAEGKIDKDNPFGASIKPGGQRGVMNIINEEGDWESWSANFSSQMLSKQTPTLIREQLGITRDRKRQEFDEIMKLTNPTVRQKLLDSFADDVDSAAVHLKAIGLKGTANHVLLPFNSIKENEVYAPNYRDGDRVALIRHPHGGIFEIPELTVNNKNPQARKTIGQARDAVGINAKVAQRLSGADFDGDHVIVIPNNNRKIKSAPALDGLKDFDPIRMYPPYPGMKSMTPKLKQQQMGVVSNLITDMTIRGATMQELARAVRHSMVVIDAEKHNLNYKQSAIDNGIQQLKIKYQSQGDGKAGAATLISRARSDVRLPARKGRPASEGGPIDRVTGKRMFVPTGETTIDRKGNVVPKTFKSKRLAEVDDAHLLSSGTKREQLYADHSNELKSLANHARRVSLGIKGIPYSPSARKTYAKEVQSLNDKLVIALKNSPLERQAQVLANAEVAQKLRANPDMEASDLKKVKSQALAKARARTGAGKQRIDLTPQEWTAIQAGAISPDKLRKILNNTDIERVKSFATPRSTASINKSKQLRARSLLAAGYTQAEVADAIGVSLSTLKNTLLE